MNLKFHKTKPNFTTCNAPILTMIFHYILIFF